VGSLIEVLLDVDTWFPSFPLPQAGIPRSIADPSS
jgi:hypothetical protein